MPGTNAGTGQPIRFRCAACRRTRVFPLGWAVVRTGRVRKLSRPRGGVRMLAYESHEYRCKCGHVGWTRHKDILDKPLETH